MTAARYGQQVFWTDPAGKRSGLYKIISVIGNHGAWIYHETGAAIRVPLNELTEEEHA